MLKLLQRSNSGYQTRRPQKGIAAVPLFLVGLFVTLVSLLPAGQLQAQTITIGSGTTANGTTTAAPINQFYRSMHFRSIYTAAEINAAGFTGPGTISHTALYITGSVTNPLPNFTIKMANVSQANLSTDYTGPMTTVYTDPSYTSAEMTLNAWNTLTLSTPFYWDGTSNIVIDWCFDQVNPTYTSTGQVRIFTPTVSAGSSRYIRSDSAPQCGVATTTTMTTKPQLQLTFVPAVACSGTPNAGTIPANLTTCPETSVTITASGTTVASGINFQWQQSTDGGNTWVNAVGGSGATTQTYITPAINSANNGIMYRLQAICTNGGSPAFSNTSTVIMGMSQACYCTSAATSASWTELFNVTFGSLNNTSTCATTGGPGSIQNMYSNYTSTVAAPSVMQGQTVPFSVTAGSCTNDYNKIIGIFIDYNQNGILTDPGEHVYTSAAHLPSLAMTGNVLIPMNALPGNTLMRVIVIETSTPSLMVPCGTYTWGETEDYYINIVQAQPCAGAPVAGTATASVATICAGSNFSLSLTGTTVAMGIGIQWQSSTDGVTYTNMPNDTLANITTSQLATSYYRAAVTCYGANTSYSNAVQVVSPGLFPAGYYTIDNGQPTDITVSNFNNFTDAVNAIKCGIAGPVTFGVMPGIAPYTEQITIPQIYGASATSRVTFQGNGLTLSYGSTNSDARAVIKLDGADYITFDSLNINATGSTYGWGYLLTNQANYNEILNSTINVGANATSSNFAGIVASASNSGITSGNSANYTLVEGNTIIGGYYGVTFYGTGTADYSYGNKVIDNNIRDTYYTSVYLYYQGDAVVTGNDVSRPTRTTFGTTYTFYMWYLSNLLVEGNSIHDMYTNGATNTSTLYGVYYGGSNIATGPENRFINNEIYNINNNGTIYGFYNSTSGGTNYYHNTVSLDHTAGTAGTTYGYYQSGAPANQIEFKNNIISITRGGSGTKYNIYLSAAAITPALFNSNNNVLYLNSAAGTNNIGYNGTARPTLALWQAQGFDQLSSGANPMFTNAAAGNLVPTNAVIDNIGSAVGVLTDITGAARSTVIPDPGAYEFNIPVPCPAPLGVTITNITCTEALINWAAADTIGEFNLIVGPVGFDPNNPLSGGVVYSGLVSGPSLIQFLTPGTNYQLYLQQDCFLAGTSTMSGPYAFSTVTCTPGVISGQGSFCYSGTPTLELSNTTPAFTIQWQDSIPGGSFVNIAGANSPTYTPSAPITQTTYFRAITNGGTGNMYSNIFEVEISSPLITATNSPVNICAPGQVTLSATASEGDVKWFDAATDGNLLHTGSTYTTSVTSNTTFYAEASTGAGLASVGPLSPAAPLGGATAVGTYYLLFDVLSATNLVSVDFFPTSPVNTAYTLVIQNSTGTSTVHTQSGVTTVTNAAAGPYTPETVLLNAALPAGSYRIGWVTYPNAIRNSSGASYPYTLPGILSITGNTFNNAAYYYYFYNFQVQSGCESPRIPVSVNIDPVLPFTVSGDTIICTGSSTTLSIASPQAGVDYTWSSAAGTLTGNSITVSPTDSVVYTITGNNATGCTASAMVSVAVNPIPVATASANSPLFMGETLSLSASGGASYNWSGPNGFASNLQNPELSNVGTAATGTYTVVVTSNQCSDTATVNVTVVDPTTPLSGTYTINQNAPASPINFTSFTSAATFLNTAGVAGPVTINVVSGTSPYLDQQFLLGNIPGTSSANTVTINGNGETLSFCATSPGNRDIVRLDGTDWLRLNNLNIIGTCSQGWGIHLLNGADNVILDGNTVTVNATSPNLSMNQGIVATNSFVDPQALGTAATNLQVLNNTVNGGYNGIRINGAEAAPSTGLVLNNNTVNNAYEYGIYVLYNNAPQIINNDVTMRAGNVRSMGYMINRIEQGITFTGNYVKNAGRRSIFLNYVNHTSTTTGLIANNMVAGGLQNQTEADGLYINYSDHLQVYHNSTVTDNSGTGYSFCVTNWGSRYIDVKNNSFAYTGNGNGYAVAVGASIMDYQQDYNNYYSNGANLGRMGNVNHPNTPAGWVSLQNAPNQFGAHDLNSMNVNPMYVSNLDLHLHPISTLITNQVPMLAAVTSDYDGDARTAMTTIGADHVAVGPRAAQAGLEATVYPNPFRKELKVELTGVEGKVGVVLSDMMGREVYRNSYEVTEAGFTVRPATEIAEGVYMLQITANGITTQYRVVKQ